MIDNPVHSIVFGSITLADEGSWPADAHGVQYVVRPTDTTWGNPSPVTVAVLSLLRQGSLVSYDHTENRNIVLRVTVVAEDSNRLALGERALQLECERSNTLTWTPPDGAGQPTVFDIVWSQLELDFDHQDELLLQRTYKITMQALPYGRNADLVVTAATETESTAVEAAVVDDGSDATNWVSLNGGSASSVAGAIVIGPSFGPQANRNATVDFTSGPYLVVVWQTSVATLSPLIVQVTSSSGTITPPQVYTSDSGGWTTSYYRVSSSVTSASSIFFRAIFGGTSGTLSIDKISIWTGLPELGTPRQRALSLIPGGSVKTQGSITVSHTANALGKTIVYTHPSSTGYLPPISRFLVSGGTRSADATAVSGDKAPLTTTSTWDIPVSVLPSGRMEVWAWLSASATTSFDLTWSAFSKMGSTALSSASNTVTLSLPTTWGLYFLGSVVVPPVDMGPAGVLSVTMLASGMGTPIVSWDEVYLFATDAGRLTIVDCGTSSPSSGGSSNFLWIDAPSAAVPMGAVYRGFASDRSDQFHAGADAQPWEIHDFEPTGTSLFVVTSNTDDATTALTHYRRYQTHVIDES
jgi:hypothetical protein